MSNENYKMRLKTDNFEIEVQGDKEFVIEKFNELKNGVKSAPTSKIKTEKQDIGEKQLPDTLPSFLKKINIPDKDPDLMAVFAYWLYHKDGLDPINSTDIGDCYNLTRIKKSKNIGQALNRCAGKGYLIKLKEKKNNKVAYRISVDGENFVDELKVS